MSSTLSATPITSNKEKGKEVDRRDPLSSSPMPVWMNDTHLSPEWLEAKINMKKPTNTSIKSCTAIDISNANRKGQKNNDGATLRLSVTMSDDTTTSLIIKQSIMKDQLTLSKKLGLSREALFYNQLKPFSEENHVLTLLNESIPNIYYSYGDYYKTGEKCIIMEDLNDNQQDQSLQNNCIDSGILFGKGNPNNWKRNIPELIKKAFSQSPHNTQHVPSSKEVALVTFCEIAKIHATYWKNDGLLTNDKTWLRGQEWLQGKGKGSWESSQHIVCSLWKKYLDSNVEVIQWDSTVRSFVEKAIHGISWNDQLKRLNPEGHWTLVHGDFWPGNVMWMIKKNHSDEKDNESSSVRFLDWEMVGLGSGPQELGQYVISNMAPVERKACEKELVQAYMVALKNHMKLINMNQSIIDSITWEYCWNEYKIGAVERWVWFLVYFVGNGLGSWAQFFHDQLSCFIKDHKLLPTDVTQPRP